jgi:hypothetical protein
MTGHKYEGPERRNQSFRIPVITLIVAMVMGLLGLAAWSVDLERRKVDKEDFTNAVSSIHADLKDIQKDVKILLRGIR